MHWVIDTIIMWICIPGFSFKSKFNFGKKWEHFDYSMQPQYNSNCNQCSVELVFFLILIHSTELIKRMSHRMKNCQVNRLGDFNKGTKKNRNWIGFLFRLWSGIYILQQATQTNRNIINSIIP